jgi:hypothetical protein
MHGWMGESEAPVKAVKIQTETLPRDSCLIGSSVKRATANGGKVRHSRNGRPGLRDMGSWHSR